MNDPRHRDDEFVEKVYRLVNGWAMLTSREQIRCVLAAAARVERERANEQKREDQAA